MNTGLLTDAVQHVNRHEPTAEEGGFAARCCCLVIFALTMTKPVEPVVLYVRQLEEIKKRIDVISFFQEAKGSQEQKGQVSILFV
jgi:hypothetical protein